MCDCVWDDYGFRWCGCDIAGEGERLCDAYVGRCGLNGVGGWYSYSEVCDD